MSQEIITFDIDRLTFGQAEFLTEETGYDINELMERLRSGNFNGRDLVVVLAVASNPDDPAAEMERIRKTPIADVQLQLAEEKDD